MNNLTTNKVYFSKPDFKSPLKMKKTSALLLTVILFFVANFAYGQSKPTRQEGYVNGKTCKTKAEAYADAVSKIPNGAVPSTAGYNGSGVNGIGQWSCHLKYIIFPK